jgi:hypothetical protein
MAAAPTKDAGVYIECVLNGGLMKVSAIDPATGTEVSVFGPANARETLKRNAVAKLVWVLKKKEASSE